jgi:hypothetical protein
MNGLMAKLENMFVRATFADGPSVNVFGRFNCLSNHKGRKSLDDINLYEEIFTVARDLYERSGLFPFHFVFVLINYCAVDLPVKSPFNIL